MHSSFSFELKIDPSIQFLVVFNSISVLYKRGLAFFCFFWLQNCSHPKTRNKFSDALYSQSRVAPNSRRPEICTVIVGDVLRGG